MKRIPEKYSFIWQILRVLREQNIQAEITPMYGTYNTKYVITLPGLELEEIYGKNTDKHNKQPENIH